VGHHPLRLSGKGGMGAGMKCIAAEHDQCE
jgi:hypothetical protein